MSKSWTAIRAVAWRECLRILQHKDLRMICFVAPLVYGLVLSSIYTNKRVSELDVGLIDQDQSRLSRTFVRWVDASQNISLEKRYDNLKEAVDAMATGETSGLLVIPKDFSRTLKRGQQSRLQMGVDSSNILVANPVNQTISEAAGTLSAGAFINYARKQGNTKDKALTLAQPLIADTRVAFNPKLNYSDFILPGLVIVVLQQILIVGLAFTVAEERENKRIAELMQKAQGSVTSLLIGKALPYIALNFVLGLFFIMFVLPYFGVVGPATGLDFGAAWLLKIALLFVFVCSVTVFGMLISTFFETTAMALIVLMFYTMPTFLLSGFQWPTESLPLPLRGLALLFPSTYFLKDYRLLLLGDVPARYFLSTFVSLLLFTVLCAAANVILFKRIVQKAE